MELYTLVSHSVDHKSGQFYCIICKIDKLDVLTLSKIVSH